jgi:hypothetical protein
MEVVRENKKRASESMKWNRKMIASFIGNLLFVLKPKKTNL